MSLEENWLWDNEQVVFNIFKAMKYLVTTDDYFVVSMINQKSQKAKKSQFSNPM